MSMTLPVYLVHWNAPEWCASAAASIMKSRDVVVRLAVIDNGGSGGEDLIRRLPADVRVLAPEENLGYAGAANVALRDWAHAFPEAEYCVIGSHDLHVAETALSSLVTAADTHREFGLLGPVVFHGNCPSDWGPAPSVEIVDRLWLSGACLLIRRKCANEIGEFDSRFGSYVEDVDYSHRARRAGWKVGVVTDSLAFHLGSQSEDVISMLESNRILFAAKYGGVLGAAAAAVALVGRALRAGFGALLPVRPREARRRSRAQLVQLTKAVFRVNIGAITSALRERAQWRPSDFDYRYWRQYQPDLSHPVRDV